MSSKTTLEIMKRGIGVALRLYTLPLRMSERVAYFAKGTCFFGGEEHLYRTTRLILSGPPVPAGAVIADVGAASGGSSRYLRRAFPRNPIFAFEPNPRMAERL